MLILKVFVNQEQIDEIHIQNVANLGDDLCGYKIRKPEIGHDPLLHKRNAGWKKLAVRVLNTLIQKEETNE